MHMIDLVLITTLLATLAMIGLALWRGTPAAYELANRLARALLLALGALVAYWGIVAGPLVMK